MDKIVSTINPSSPVRKRFFIAVSAIVACILALACFALMPTPAKAESKAIRKGKATETFIRGTEYLRPGQHVLVFRVSRAFLTSTTKRFSDVPFIGTFTGRGTDCTHGVQFFNSRGVTGEAFDAIVGWGQVEGDGHPGSSSDQCAAWIDQLMLDFDVSQFAAIPVKRLDRAVLSYREQEAPRCTSLVYTKGGFLVDSLPCWTGGDGRPESKQNGCLSLRVPSEDWINNPPQNRPVARQEFPVQKIASSSWDVTELFRLRHTSGLVPQSGAIPTGVGYMLTGDPLDIGNLTADDNTRCSSLISDVRLEVTYTIPPSQTRSDNEPPPLH